jgi:serine/threonine-protein phosphatase 5
LAAILKPKDALKDFRECVKLDPANKDAKLKLEECKKIVRKLEFFAAIEVGEEPSAAEGLDLDSMVVEPEYDGVRLENEMTQEFIEDMLERFKSGKKIHRKYVYQIILAVKDIVYKEATMVEMEIPADVTLTVCGDTHGQLAFRPVPPFCTNVYPRPIFRPLGIIQAQWQTNRQTLLPF